MGKKRTLRKQGKKPETKDGPQLRQNCEERKCRPDSVENRHSSRLSVTAQFEHPTHLFRTEPPSNTGLFGLAPCRVYLISLQQAFYHSCTYFLLHLSSPCDGRALPATLLLWCPDLPPPSLLKNKDGGDDSSLSPLLYSKCSFLSRSGKFDVGLVGLIPGLPIAGIPVSNNAHTRIRVEDP